jgi:hypothetical protein
MKRRGEEEEEDEPEKRTVTTSPDLARPCRINVVPYQKQRAYPP